MDMLSTTNLLVTNYSSMIAMLTGIGGLLAWSLPTHCLHSLENWPPLQRAFRQCVEHVQAMESESRGSLLAILVPTDCLRSLENQPPFQRAFRQYVGNPEAIYPLYDKVRQQPDYKYAMDQKAPVPDRICNDPSFERTRENMAEFGQYGTCCSLSAYFRKRSGHSYTDQNLKFQVTAGMIGNRDTCRASTFRVPS
jgi:hypothetical protein